MDTPAFGLQSADALMYRSIGRRGSGAMWRLTFVALQFRSVHIAPDLRVWWPSRRRSVINPWPQPDRTAHYDKEADHREKETNQEYPEYSALGWISSHFHGADYGTKTDNRTSKVQPVNPLNRHRIRCS